MTATTSNAEENARMIARLRAETLKDAQRYGPLNQPKLDLLDFAFRRLRASSFADLGAAYRVDGGYSFYAMDACGAGKAILVDIHPTERMLAEAAARNGVAIVRGNFGDAKIAERVGEVDAVVLFDVLLHQASPDWDKLLDLYAPRTRLFVIHNPQWTGPESVKLLGLGEEEYLATVPKTRNEAVYRAAIDRPEEISPVHGRPNRDGPYVWQWGITDSDMISKMQSLGFNLRYFQDHGLFWELQNFRNHAFIFENDAGTRPVKQQDQ